MLSARPAEWLIARFTGETRAASIVGDLLEELPERGAEWFWFSIVAIVLSLTWRYLLGLGAGLILGRILGSLLVLIALPSLQPLLNELGKTCTLLWVAAPYTAIRYGLRDRFAQLMVSICVILSTVFACWRIPAVLVASLGLGTLVVLACLVLSSLRKSLLSVSITLVLGYFATPFAFALGEKYAEWMPPSVSRSEQRQYLGILFSAVFLVIACESTHRLFCRSIQQSSATN